MKRLDHGEKEVSLGMNKNSHSLPCIISVRHYHAYLVLNELNDTTCKIVVQVQATEPDDVAQNAILDQKVKDLESEYDLYENKVREFARANGR